MNFLVGKCDEAFLMLHGGAGPMDPSREGLEKATESLAQVAKHAIARWDKDHKLQLAQLLLEELENDSGFNAGYGSALQRDGVARLSAAIMDGRRQRFSGVISISDVKHPSRLALRLQSFSSRVLTAPGHLNLAREMNEPIEDLISPERFDRWLKAKKEHATQGTDCDTVGVVLSSENNGLIAGTSTGGRGNEMPGRVSDSATVAGNYASSFAAISLTGIGEQIVDDAVAVRIETRVRDGMSLEDACRKTYEEALAGNREYGWIASDGQGHWCIAHTTEAMTYFVRTIGGEVLASSKPELA